MKVDLKLHDSQMRVYQSNARFKVVVAGRRWGKTLLARTEQIIRAAKPTNHPDSESWYIAPTFTLAKRIYWKPLKRLAGDLIAKTWESEGTLELVTGRTIHLKGADDPDSLRGNALEYVVLDEYADMKPEVWDEVIQPALADTGGEVLFIGTPKGRNNHFYQLYLEADSGDDEDWEAFTFKTLDNPFIPEKEVERARRRMSRQSFRQEFEADFDIGAGTIFSNTDMPVLDIVPPEGNIYMTVDPAGFGSTQTVQNKSRFAKLDETAIAICQVDQHGWLFHNVISGRWDVRETATRILAAAREYKPIVLGIEKGALMNALLPYLQEQQARYGVFLPIHPISHVGNMRNKQSRITWSLQGRIEKGLVRLLRGDYINKVVDQLKDFPNGQHDDLIDAMSMMDFISSHMGDGDDYYDTWEPEDDAVGY